MQAFCQIFFFERIDLQNRNLMFVNFFFRKNDLFYCFVESIAREIFNRKRQACL